jgi:hypothetical protein
MWVFGDSRVTYRESLSSDGTPAVQLTIASSATGIRSGQKIHFIKFIGLHWCRETHARCVDQSRRHRACRAMRATRRALSHP